MKTGGRPIPRILEELARAERGVNRETLEQLLTLAVELAREGREGQKVGTILVLGDTDAVLQRSRPLILDPLRGHPDEQKRITNPDMRETAKELAQLDGGFVVRDDGVVVSAARYFNADAKDIELPLGLGARHVAAASISRQTRAVAIVVSKSSVVRLFDDGELVCEIMPELWMLQSYGVLDSEQTLRQTEDGLTIVRTSAKGEKSRPASAK